MDLGDDEFAEGPADPREQYRELINLRGDMRLLQKAVEEVRVQQEKSAQLVKQAIGLGWLVVGILFLAKYLPA